MIIELSTANLTTAALILKPENRGDELQLAQLRALANSKHIDNHAWENDEGRGLTFYVKDRDHGQ